MGLREESKKEFRTAGSVPTENELKVGAIQRIADATEKMATNYDRLVEEKDRFKRMYERTEKENKLLYRRVYALKGVITKLKKKGTK